MEKNIRSKITNYEGEFKENLKKWLFDNDASIICDNTCDKTNEFIQHLSDFPRLDLTSQDFQSASALRQMFQITTGALR